MKKHLLKSLLAVALLLVCGNVWGETVTFDFTQQGYENGMAIESASIDDNVTVTFAKGSNDYAPTYYTSGTAIRCYGGNSFTVASTSGNITSITLTFGTSSSDGTNEISTNVGTFTSPTWSGNAESVIFTIGGTSGNRRLAGISVTYTPGEGDDTGGETYTITYHVLGEEVTDGDNPAVDGLTFEGWTTNASYAGGTEKPQMYTEGTLTENIDLYAVFSKTKVSDGGEACYQLVESALSDWRGDYLVAFSSTIFMNGSLRGGKDYIGASGSSVSPGKKLNGNIVSADWGDQYYVTIEAIDDNDLSKGYVIKSHSSISPYFYQTNNSNGMAATDNKSTAAKYPLSVTFVSSSDIKISNPSGAVLHYNDIAGSTGQMFRFYKDGGQKPVYLYKKVGGETTTKYYSTFAKSVTIKSVGWATLYLDYATLVPTSMNAYVASGCANGQLTLQKVEEIPANTGVLLESANGGEITDQFMKISTDETVSVNFFKGTTTDDVFCDEDYTYYILTMGEYGLGFYWDPQGKTDEDSAEGKAANCAANKAVLAIPSTLAASAIGFRLDGTTMVEQLLNDNKDVEIYDLQGRKVENATKGLYIVNGKKVMLQ